MRALARGSVTISRCVLIQEDVQWEMSRGTLEETRFEGRGEIPGDLDRDVLM